MRTLALAAVVMSMSVGCVSMSKYDKKNAEANKFRQDWEDEAAKRALLQERIRTMQEQVDTLSADMASLREKIKSDEGTMSVKESELRAARDKLVEMQALVDELSKSKKKLEAAKAELEKKSGEYEQLATALKGEIEAGRVELSYLRGQTTVKMTDKILFASGSATIGADGKAALRTVAQALRSVLGKTIRVEGHTDNVPTSAGSAFGSNWDLSVARSLAVVRFLQELQRVGDLAQRDLAVRADRGGAGREEDLVLHLHGGPAAELGQLDPPRVDLAAEGGRELLVLAALLLQLGLCDLELLLGLRELVDERLQLLDAAAGGAELRLLLREGALVAPDLLLERVEVGDERVELRLERLELLLRDGAALGLVLVVLVGLLRLRLLLAVRVGRDAAGHGECEGEERGGTHAGSPGRGGRTRIVPRTRDRGSAA